MVLSTALQQAQKAYASLLNSSQHSDLAIKCGGTYLNAHRVMLCTRSSMFAALVQEIDDSHGEREPMVEINEFDLDTVKRMLSYIYTSDYDDDSDINLGPSADGREGVEDSDEESEGPPSSRTSRSSSSSGSSQDSSDDDSDEGSESGDRENPILISDDVPERIHHPPQPEVGTQGEQDVSELVELEIHKSEETKECKRVPWIKEEDGEISVMSYPPGAHLRIKISRTNRALINNCRVHSMAERYKIEDLRDAAFNRFIQLSKYNDEHREWTPEGFIHVVNEVYRGSDTPSNQDLKKRVAFMSYLKRRTVWENQGFAEKARQNTDFVTRFAGEMMDRSKGRIDGLEERVDQLEQEKEDLESQVSALKKQIKALEKAARKRNATESEAVSTASSSKKKKNR
ncbi:MAG: hypothetical protein M1831_007457 [Alyxoria varia]|nr:MAG: hypothetical protein M1831_007457 [Alyxoria varia]